MTTYSDIAIAATSADFKRRVRYALVQAAISIYNEATSVTNHAIRAAYATKVTNSQVDLDGPVLGVLSDATIKTVANSSAADNGVTDAMITNAVAGIYNVLAGA